MLELIVVLLCIWLFFKALGLSVRLAWGTVRIIANILFALALPMLIGCILFAGGLLILLPLGLLALAFGLLRCIVS